MSSVRRCSASLRRESHEARHSAHPSRPATTWLRGLTPLDALELVGTARLAARVFELEAEGYRIERTLETTPRGARVARYRLIEMEQLAAFG